PIVLVSDFGLTPVGHPNGGAGNFYCSGAAAGDGSWSCSGSTLTVGHPYEVSGYAQDAIGHVSGSPDDEFSMEILPPPTAPVVLNPSPGFGELSPIVFNANVDSVTTEVRVTDGGTDLCGALVPVALHVTCNPALSVGTHTLDVTAYD